VFSIIKKQLKILILLVFIIANTLVSLSPITPTAIGINDIFVSTSGSDANTGSILSPFKSIAKAQDYIRRNKTSIAGNIIVNIRGGEYFLDQTLKFEPEDSGSATQNITYQSYIGEIATIHGGVSPSNPWSIYDSVQNIYRTNIGQLKTYPRQLYVNDSLATRAKSEEKPTWLTVNTTTGYDIDVSKNLTSWQNISDIEVINNWNWIQDRCLVDNVTGANLNLDSTCFNTIKSLISSNPIAQPLTNPQWIENAFELLDSENEWYYNKSDGYLYYKPLQGVNPSALEFRIPQTEKLIDIKGRNDFSIKNLTFKNLTFKYGAWQQTNLDKYYIIGQAGVLNDGKPPFSQLSLEYTDNIKIENSIFKNLGSSAILSGKGTKNSKIYHNTIQNIDGNGISIGDLDSNPVDPQDITSGATVYNNLIDNVGQQYKSSVGVLQMYANTSVIKHNEILNLPYSGMNIGWGWDDITKNINYGTVIENNKVHDVLKVLRDGSGIYHNSMDGGTKTSYNYVYNLGIGNQSAAPGDAGINGIYYDNGSTFKEATFNVIQSSPWNWFNSWQDSHSNNTWTNNFSDTGNNAITSTIVSPVANNIFTNNQVFSSLNQYPEVNPIIQASGICPIKNDNVGECDNNIKCVVNSTDCTNQKPVGKIDKFVGNKIYFYAKDPDSNSPLTAEIFVAIPEEQPNSRYIQKIGTSFLCNLPRTDIFSGFSAFGCEIDIPTIYLNNEQYTIYVRVKDVDTGENIYIDREAFVWNEAVSSDSIGAFVCDKKVTIPGTTTNCKAPLATTSNKVLNSFVIDSNGLFAGVRDQFGIASSFLGNSSPCTILGNEVTCNNVIIPSNTSEGIKEIVGHRPNIEYITRGAGIDVFNSSISACNIDLLPLVLATTNWGQVINNFLCQTTDSTGKLISDFNKLTNNSKVGIGTNNPNTILSITNLDNYASEVFATQNGLKNGDFYRTGDQVKVVVNGQNIVPALDSNTSDPDCFNSLNNSTRLPVQGGDTTTWGSLLNNYLCKTLSNKSGQEGKLKSDLASLTNSSKVGIGTPSPTNIFAIKGLFNMPVLQDITFADGDVFHTNGTLKVKKSTVTLNISTPNPNDCYSSAKPTRLPKVNQDDSTWGDILNNFLCRSHLNGGVNSGKLKTDLSSIVEGGKIGIGTNNPGSVLSVPNLPDYANNLAAISAGLKDGDIYRNGNNVMVVY
jgi:hypothetical protein